MNKNQKKAFQIAIASSPLKNVAHFARKIGVSHPAVCRVLSGKMKSRRIFNAIEKLIDSESKKLYGRKAA
jgi:hypothetical protein